MKRDYKGTTGIDAAQRSLIKMCAEHGVGIEDLGNGSTFRFEPAANRDWQNAPPSSRGHYSPPCTRKGCPCKKARNWKPTKLSLAPQYKVPMAGDPPSLTWARAQWADGNAHDLLDYLATAKVRSHEA